MNQSRRTYVSASTAASNFASELHSVVAELIASSSFEGLFEVHDLHIHCKYIYDFIALTLRE
jgi:hypothetical protein